MYVVSNLCVIRGRCWRESLTWGGRRCLNPTRVSACHDSTTLPLQATNLPAVTNAPSHRTVFTVYPTLRGGATRTTPSPLTNNMGMFLLVDYRDTTKENAYFTARLMMSDILKIFFSKIHLTEKPSCSNLLPRLLNGTSSRTSAYLVWKMFLTPQISLSVIYLKCCCVWLVDLSFEPASQIVFPQYSRRQPTVSDWLTHDDQTRFPQSSVHVQTCWGVWSTTTVAAQ